MKLGGRKATGLFVFFRLGSKVAKIDLFDWERCIKPRQPLPNDISAVIGLLVVPDAAALLIAPNGCAVHLSKYID